MRTKLPKYPGLLIDENGKFYFRKYSQVKQDEFNRLIKGVEGKKNAAVAYKKAVDEYNTWLGEAIERKDIKTFAQLANMWLARLDKKFQAAEKGGSKSSHQIGHLCVKNHLLPEFGHLKFKNYDSEKWATLWQNYCTNKRAEQRAQYKHLIDSGDMTASELERKLFKFFNTRKTFKSILILGKDLKVISEIPRKLHNPDPEESDKHIYLYPDEVKRILENIESENVKLGALLAYQTGMRPMEVFSIYKQQIKYYGLDKAVVSLTKEQTKTRKGRDVPILGPLAQIIRLKGESHESNYIFPSPKNPKKHLVSYDEAWRDGVKKAGLTGVTMYSLRHSMLTDRADSKANILTLAEYTGTSAKMLQDVYYKATDEVLDAIAGMADSTLTTSVISNYQPPKLLIDITADTQILNENSEKFRRLES